MQHYFGEFVLNQVRFHHGMAHMGTDDFVAGVADQGAVKRKMRQRLR